MFQSKGKLLKTLSVMLIVVVVLVPMAALVWASSGIVFGVGNDVGTADDAVRSVAVGDLDGDGDLDIVSGDGDEGSAGAVIVWENDGTPFTSLWTKHILGTGNAVVESVAVGYLDGGDDLDIVSGYDNGDVIAWENGGGLFPITWMTHTVGTDDRNRD